jgi:DNA-binding XRE family transcriptional regulator
MVSSKESRQGDQGSGGEIVTKLETVLERKTAPRPVSSDLPAPEERKRLREALDLTQAEVAEIIGAKRASVGAYEAGRWEPRGEIRTNYIALLAEIEKRLGEEGK